MWAELGQMRAKKLRIFFPLFLCYGVTQYSIPQPPLSIPGLLPQGEGDKLLLATLWSSPLVGIRLQEKSHY